MSIGDKQIQIINNIKSFLEKLSLSDIDISLSSLCYFASWIETPGYARIKFQSNGWFFIFRFCKIILKSTLAIASHAKYIEIKNNNDIKFNYELMIISWAYKKNFLEDGSFQDRYFSVNSKEIKNSYWVLISMDGYVPLNLNSNIKVIKRKKGIIKYNFFFLIKTLISIIIDSKFSLRKICHYLFFHSYFAKLFSNIIIKDIKKNKFKAILLPYEAQPFQNKVFFEAKKIDKNIKTIGYLHSLSPLTSELVYRPGAPDSLLVHGKSQIEILKSKLNWPENRLTFTHSFRFKINSEPLSKKIFIPMSLHDSEKFLKEFKKLLMDSPENYFPKLDIKEHPGVINSKKHLKFKKKLEKIIKLYKNRFSDSSKNNNISVFFGVTTAILEALERGVETIHICTDSVFQSYNEKIWKDLKVVKISKFTFNYNLISQGRLINFGDNSTFNQYLKTLLLN